MGKRGDDFGGPTDEHDRTGGGSGGGGGGGGPPPSNIPKELGENPEEAIENVKDCWMDTDVKLEGYEDTDYTWSFEEYGRGTTADLYGAVDQANSKIYLFAEAIKHNRIEADFIHLAVYTSMHEWVHAIQGKKERADGDGRDLASPYEWLDNEWEAYELAAKWYEAIFDTKAPVAAQIYGYNETLTSDGTFRKKRRDYKKLEKKIAKGETLTTKEQEEMDELRQWFSDHLDEHLVHGEYDEYDPDAELGCVDND